MDAKANPEPTGSVDPDISVSWPITFHRTGGFAGVDQKLTVDKDGTATLNARGKEKFTCTVKPTTLSAITDEAKTLKAMGAKKPSEKKKGPKSDPPVADAFNYLLTINGQEYNYTGGESIPKSVRPMITAMSDVLQSAVAIRDDAKAPKDSSACTA